MQWRDEVHVVCVLQGVTAPGCSCKNVFVLGIYLNVKVPNFLQS